MEKSSHTKENDLVRAQLKAAREAAQLTQRALAARLGVPHSWVAKVEAGDRRVDVVEFCWVLFACDKQAPRALAKLAKKIAAVYSDRTVRHKRGE